MQFSLQAHISWGSFKAEASQKLGIPAKSVAVFWEDCAIDEEDDRPLGMIAKDGDILTLVPSHSSDDDQPSQRAAEQGLSQGRHNMDSGMTGLGDMGRLRLVSNGTSRQYLPAPSGGAGPVQDDVKAAKDTGESVRQIRQHGTHMISNHT